MEESQVRTAVKGVGLNHGKDHSNASKAQFIFIHSLVYERRNTRSSLGIFVLRSNA
jgi:hypothetical protein